MSTETLSLTIALLAVIVGPLVSLWIAKKQIHSQLFHSTRIANIEKMRELMAELLSALDNLNEIFNTDQEPLPFEKTEVLFDSKNVFVLYNRLDLYLRVDDELSLELRGKVRDIIKALGNPKSSIDDNTTIITSIGGLFQKVLRNEYELIKKGKSF